MARILITSGPTRQYLDPVRFLSNASSGRMGCALAEAALEAGHDVVIVSGPVDITYPKAAEVIDVISTEDMLEACLEIFPECDGLIGVAAPCDYRPIKIETKKIAKTGDPLRLSLVETPDVVALLGAVKDSQWMVAFALETNDRHIRAMQKLERKNCDIIILNGPDALYSTDTSVEIINHDGTVLSNISGSKQQVARDVLQIVNDYLIEKQPTGAFKGN